MDRSAEASAPPLPEGAARVVRAPPAAHVDPAEVDSFPAARSLLIAIPDELRCEPVRSTQMLDINVNQADRIATLTLNRPEKRNALSLEFMHQLTCALADIGQRSDVSVVILNANGPVFSSGHDLGEL